MEAGTIGSRFMADCLPIGIREAGICSAGRKGGRGSIRARAAEQKARSKDR